MNDNKKRENDDENKNEINEDDDEDIERASRWPGSDNIHNYCEEMCHTER